MTPDRIADLTTVPKKLAVIGASPRKSHAHPSVLAPRLAKPSSSNPAVFSPSEDPELTAPLLTALRLEGLEIIEDADIRSLELAGSGTARGRL